MEKTRRHAHTEPELSKRALLFSVISISVILVVEVLGGLWTHSLALLSDSAHVFMDLLSCSLSLGAIALSERPISDSRTFGWHRIEVFAAVINGLLVLGMSALIMFEAFHRLSAPQPVLSLPMIAIASVGLIVNLIVVWKLKPHSRRDVNVKSAFLHAMGDAVASVAVIVGGTLVWLTGRSIFDPAAALVVSVILLVNVFAILRESLQILLEGVPSGFEKSKIVEAIEEVSGPQSVKDFHLWNLCSHICAVSLHLTLPESRMPQQKDILEKIHASLEKKFNIVHTTIQIESDQWHP